MKKIEKKYWIPGIGLLLWMGIFAFINGNCQSFWADEIASIGLIRNGVSLSEVIDTCLHVDGNMPLYPMILYAAYRVMPYGEQYLLLPSILFCLVGVVLLAFSAGRLKGNRGGFIALCMGASSGILIWQSAWEIRCYALTFMLSAFALYAYIGKSIRPDRKRLVLWGAAYALCLWTHWFAVILLAFYGLVDLVRVFLRKISWKQLFCYVPGSLLYFPWLILSFYYEHGDLETYKGMAPQWKEMVWTVLFYSDGNRILWYLCLLTCAALFICAVYFLRRPLSEKKKIYLWGGVFCAAATGWTIGIVFLFSRYLMESSALYVQRYFTVIQPHILLVTALGIDCILDFADNIEKTEIWTVPKIPGVRLSRICAWTARLAVLLLMVYSFARSYRNEYIAIRKPFHQYREIAEFLHEEKGIYDEKSLFVASNRYCMLDGFIHYYFEKRGYEPPANITGCMVLSGQESRFYGDYTQFSEEELLSFDRIYCLRVHMSMDDALQRFLEEHFRMTEAYYEDGIQIWERRDSSG